MTSTSNTPGTAVDTIPPEGLIVRTAGVKAVPIVPESETPVVAGDDNILRLRVLHRGMKVATREFAIRCQVEKDGPGSKTWQQIADEVGCSLSTVMRSLREIAPPRSPNVSGDASDDLEAAPREQLPAEPSVPDPNRHGPAEAEIVEGVERHKAEQPIGAPTDARFAQKALAAAVEDFERCVAHMTTLVSPGQATEDLRRTLINAIEKVLT